MAQKIVVTQYKLDANESTDWIEVATLYPKQELGNHMPLPYFNAIMGGTFNTGTVTVEVADDSSGTNVTGDTTTYTANGIAKIEVTPGFWVRFTMTGVGTDDVDISLAVYQ